MCDFDGVTHPAFPREDRTDDQNQYFHYLPAIEAVLRAHPHVGVVITSSWRHVKPLDTLRSYFSEDMRDRVVGITPDVRGAPGDGEAGLRQSEVEQWLEAHGHGGAPWVALDDVPSGYRLGAPVVVTPDGFGASEARRLHEALDNPKSHTWRG